MMAKRDPKTGKLILDDEDETQVEILSEARYRSAKRLQAEAQEKACKRGNHDDGGSGKCEACGADIKKAAPADDVSVDPPAKKRAILM